MHLKGLLFVCVLTSIIFPFHHHATFIAERESLKLRSHEPDVVMIASTGRSGSTMLTKQISKYIPHEKILKTHLLPPDRTFRGKIIFIFSNPDQAAESALYMTLHVKSFGERHFNHVETADRDWLRKIGDPRHQTEQDNLLSYDAFGTYEHLKAWLYTQTKPTQPKHAQILAIKYENLWERNTLYAIRSFLGIPSFTLPPKKTRGHKKTDLYSNELLFRKMYNLSTEKKPRYAAYDEARTLWEMAPPFQYLKISRNTSFANTP